VSFFRYIHNVSDTTAIVANEESVNRSCNVSIEWHANDRIRCISNPYLSRGGAGVYRMTPFTAKLLMTACPPLSCFIQLMKSLASLSFIANALRNTLAGLRSCTMNVNAILGYDKIVLALSFALSDPTK